MKYYWININSSVYRKIFMEIQFNISNTDNFRISAITPELLPEILEDKPPYKCGNVVCSYNNFRDCPFEFSCICSHLSAIKEGYNSGDDYFIVCEDDIYFPFKINYDELIKNLPHDCHILQMMVLDTDAYDNIYKNNYKNNNEIFIKFNPQMKLFSTGMYLISRKGAEILLNLTYNPNGKFDLSKINIIRQADFLLYLSVNTYTTTIPYCLPYVKFLSEIHPHHYHIHQLSINKINEVHNDLNENDFNKIFINEKLSFNDFDNLYINLISRLEQKEFKPRFYWINVDSAINRKIFMENQFKERNIDNVRVSAITPHNLKDVLTDEPPYFCGYIECRHNGAKDCIVEYSVLCSHLKAIKEGYDSGEDYFIICEDDIYFMYNLDFTKIIKSLPLGFNILQMMVISSGHTDFFYNKFYINDIKLIRYTPITSSAGFYLISRKGAKEILDKYLNTENNKFHFDNCQYLKLADVLIFQSTNSCVSTFPFSIPNIEFKSLIHEQHFDAHKSAFDKIKEIYDKHLDNKHEFVINNYPIEDLSKFSKL
jgi:GR25 family glycosyltransferase involved in LPS biosynthesis